MHKVRFLVIAATGLVGLGAALAYFAGAFHEKDHTVEPDHLPIEGELFTTKLQPVSLTSTIPGTITPTDETIIGSRLLASINEINVRAGDHVDKGALLIVFDDASLRAIVEQREQAISSARAASEESILNRDRASQLFEASSLSRADYDRAMTNYRIAEAELQRAEQAAAEAQSQLGYTRILAPISGTIQERYIEPGDTATPGQALLKLYNPGRLRVEAILPESLIAFVNPGDELTAHIDALDTTVTSVVEEIVPSADPGSRTFRVKALLPAVASVYPGMFARLEVPLGTEERLLIPTIALLVSGQLTMVNVIKDRLAQTRIIRTGKTHDNMVEVVSGIDPGEIVLVKAQSEQ